ncbi:MAG: vitamin K epoxide reductase family protein [Candidatus Pacebacteria bacterium]|jgi:uncharacterized membrane protein|nr:vitamin K epoxide reductase family protein [Candidatus Paceibacterota bacterium]
MIMFWEILVLFAACGGFSLAFFIGYKKRHNQQLVCPLKGICTTVIESTYSRFFGIPVERIGVLYYAVVILVHALFLVYPTLATPVAVFILSGATLLAFLFSLYLVFIQLFSLRAICTWCMLSAGLSTIIFFATVIPVLDQVVGVLAEYKRAVVGLHLVGMAIGLGGATIADIFFFKFLKDFKISKSEADTMDTISQVIWIGLALLIISGIGLYLPEIARLNNSPKFLLKAIVVSVILVNGLFLNLLIAPRLIKISFGEKHRHRGGELHHIRKIAFALGAISISSWYSAFVLGMLRSSPASFGILLSIYASLLLLGIIVSQVMDRRYVRMAKESVSDTQEMTL